MGRKAKDLTGMKFDRLTVIKEYGRDKHGCILWLCKCECGNEVVVYGISLRSGNTKSCGCYRKDKASATFKKLNEEKWKDEEYRKMHSDKMKEINERLWKDEEYKQMQKNMQHNYKGGITPISIYLRMLPIVSQWRKDTYIRENNKCQLTGKYVHGGNSDVHHLYGFNMIVLEAHNINAIEIKPQVKDYTEEELKLLEDYVANWHKDTSNAVLLCDEVHNLFHHIYGKGNNTKEQFEEFKERYLNGEFSDLLGDDLNV